MKRAIVLVLLAACGAPAKPQPAPAAQTTAPTPQPTAPAAQTTRLKTRAHPFAIYVARMHRRLHERWAVAFLGSLARRPASDPLNDPTLAVTLELSIDAQGALVAAQVVKPSPQRQFDEAAVDAFRVAAPFDAPPEAIRAKDGLVHLRWTLHRDDRECGTFGVEPLLD